MPHCRPMALNSGLAVASPIAFWTTIRSLLWAPLSPLDIVPSMIFTFMPLRAGPR